MLIAIYLLGGLAILTIGAELLVKGASALARHFGISPLVIGLTVVAYGTSAPELAVSVSSALSGQSDIALGNVVGSNIFNVLFILGISSLFVPLTVHRQLIRLDVPLMVLLSIGLLVLSEDGFLGRLDGALFVLGLVTYTVVAIKKGRKDGKIAAEGGSKGDPSRFAVKDLGMLVAGLGLLVGGANMFVIGAVDLARLFGVSELVIGLTIVAAGTSLPEVATSVVAALRGERDIAVGNIVGSNMFNILSVLGFSALLNPVAVSPAALSTDIPFMVAIAVLCLPTFYTHYTISREEGIGFLTCYVAYTTYVVLDALGHPVVSTFRSVAVGYVIPIVAIALTVRAAEFRLKRIQESENASV